MTDSPTADSMLKFVNVLNGAAKEQYICKFQGSLGVPLDELPSPNDNQRIDDICKWPAVEFGHHFSCGDTRELYS